ncbi:MAG: CBS domain-containing protein, partial [Fibrobacter sp.]|nr:CBS domain-containing protein [Fibrobacter sp.]
METRIFRDCVSSYIRTDTINFSEDTSVDMVLNQIRRRNISDQIVYFYVVDRLQRLRGVLPLRRLLSASPEQLVGEVMVKNVVTVCSDDSIANTCKVFTKHKYLSLPVIDKEEKFIGVLDVTALTGGDMNPGQKQ